MQIVLIIASFLLGSLGYLRQNYQLMEFFSSVPNTNESRLLSHGATQQDSTVANGSILVPNYNSSSGIMNCPDTTFAVHNSIINDITCFYCPQNFTCQKGVLSPKPGIWIHPNSESYYLIARVCPAPTACVNQYNCSDLSYAQDLSQCQLAQVDPHRYLTICAYGYKGNFCHSCIDDWTKTSLNICSQCPSWPVNLTIILVLLLLFFLIVYYLIKTTIVTAFEPEELYSIGLKIIVNYVQVILLCFQYKIKWPSTVQSLTNYSHSSDKASNSASSNYFFSIKCILQGKLKNSLSEEDSYYARVYFVMCLPILLYILSLLMIEIMKRVKTIYKEEHYKVPIIIIPFLLVYPTIMTYAFSPLACVSLSQDPQEYFDERAVFSANDYYLIENRNIVCDARHERLSYWCIGFGIVVWGLLIPLWIFRNLFKLRKNLYIHEVKYKYGFLFNGYKHNRYYWEFIILLKKLIIVGLTVFMQESYSENLQSTIIIITLLFFSILQLYFKPYVSRELNTLELMATIVAFCTVILGTIYSDPYYLNESSTNIVVLIIIVNFGFILYWFKFMLREGITYVIKSFDFLKKRFHKDDTYDPNISREFVEIEFIYMKESQILYTQIQNDYRAPVNYLGSVQNMNSLWSEILRIEAEDYKNNVGPVLPIQKRRKTKLLKDLERKKGI